MYVASVIPIARGIAKDELSYFTAEPIAPGTLVTIPLRNREIPGIITDISDVRAHKATLRTSDFSLRKIIDVRATTLSTPLFWDAAGKAAIHFAATRGAILDTLIPQPILDKPPELPPIGKPTQNTGSTKVLQASSGDRYAHYQRLVSETLSDGKSVFVMCPTIHTTHAVFDQLQTIENPHKHLLHSRAPAKQIRETWERAAIQDEPLLLVATGTFFSIPRTDVGLVIVEHEHSPYYKLQARPFVDLRVYAKYLAESFGATLLLADDILQVETLYELEHGLAQPERAPVWQYDTPSTQEIVDMREAATSGTGFHAVSTELFDHIDRAHNSKERIFVLTARRGLAPLTVCQDCGATVSCDNCSAPVALYDRSSKKARRFLCHHCGKARAATEYCRVCNSWNLLPLGVGIERIITELEEHFSKDILFRIDSDTTPTHADTQRALEEWSKTPGGILLGTQMALPYLKTVDLAAIASIDALLSLPDFRVHERVFELVHTLHMLSPGAFVLQTHQPNHPAVQMALSGSVKEFYEQEIRDRRAFSYPPFSTLIKLVIKGTRDHVQKNLINIKKVFSAYKPLTFPARVPKIRNEHVVHALISVPQTSWPNNELLELLRELPQDISVDVEPLAIL